MRIIYNKSNLLIHSFQDLNKLKTCLFNHHPSYKKPKRHIITTPDIVKKYLTPASSSEDPKSHDIPPPNNQEPKKCGEAIKIGLDLFKSNKYEEALKLFVKSLELPGNGAYRLPGRATEYSCPSETEERAAMYNIACCYAKMNEKASCLTFIKGLLECGFDDFEILKKDKDLEIVRGKELNELIAEYDTIQSKIKKKMANKNNEKPWLLW